MPAAKGYRPENVTDHQRRCWDALQEHKSVRAAADALGIVPFSLRSGAEMYQRHMGLSGPLPYTKLYRSRLTSQDLVDARAETAALRDENDRLRGEVRRLTERLAIVSEAAQPWVAVHKKLDALLARPAGVTPISHRRKADGGVGGRRERRAAGGRR